MPELQETRQYCLFLSEDEALALRELLKWADLSSVGNEATNLYHWLMNSRLPGPASVETIQDVLRVYDHEPPVG